MEDYTIIKDGNGIIQSIIRNKAPAASIPVCAGNSDYSQYLEDVKTGASVDEIVMSEPTLDATPSLQDQIDAILELI